MKSATKYREMRGLEIGDDELAEGSAAVRFSADRIVTFDLPELKPFIESPDVGMIIIRKDEPAFKVFEDICQAFMILITENRVIDIFRSNKGRITIK